MEIETKHVKVFIPQSHRWELVIVLRQWLRRLKSSSQHHMANAGTDTDKSWSSRVRAGTIPVPIRLTVFYVGHTLIKAWGIFDKETSSEAIAIMQVRSDDSLT